MLDGSTCRGGPAEIDMSAAVAQSGSVQIELIAQHDDKPSPYLDMYPVVAVLSG